MTAENDIVLIYFEDEPLTYARIESILPDSKPDWYHIKLLMLQVPLAVVTWILRDAYVNGTEFTMNSKRMRIEKVVCPADPDLTAQENKGGEEAHPPHTSSSPNVISLKDRQKS